MIGEGRLKVESDLGEKVSPLPQEMILKSDKVEEFFFLFKGEEGNPTTGQPKRNQGRPQGKEPLHLRFLLIMRPSRPECATTWSKTLRRVTLTGLEP